MLFFPQFFFQSLGFLPSSCDFPVCDWRQEYSATLKIIFLFYFLAGWRSNGNHWDLNLSVLLCCCCCLWGFFGFGWFFYFFFFRKVFWTSNLSTWSILCCILLCRVNLAFTCVWVVGKIWGDRRIHTKSCVDKSEVVCLPPLWILHIEKGIPLPNVPCVIAWIKAMLRFFFKGIFWNNGP